MDPSSAFTVIEKVGYYIAALLGLLYVLRWLSKTHLLALNSRIATLERVTKEKEAVIEKRNDQLDVAHKAMLAQAEAHARVSHEQTMAVLQEMAATRRAAIQSHAVLSRLLDSLAERPCQHADHYHPHPTPAPTASDLPRPPNEQTTSIIGGRA